MNYTITNISVWFIVTTLLNQIAHVYFSEPVASSYVFRNKNGVLFFIQFYAGKKLLMLHLLH